MNANAKFDLTSSAELRIIIVAVLHLQARQSSRMKQQPAFSVYIRNA